MRGPTSTFDDSDDATLVTAMLAGSREAFATLFERHRDAVYRFARQMGGSAEMADDVTQDVFVSFMETGQRFDPERGSLKTYLYGIARNLILRRLRTVQSGRGRHRRACYGGAAGDDAHRSTRSNQERSATNARSRSFPNAGTHRS